MKYRTILKHIEGLSPLEKEALLIHFRTAPQTVRQKILAHLEEGPHTRAELAEKIGTNANVVGVFLTRLKTAGLLRNKDKSWSLAG